MKDSLTIERRVKSFILTRELVEEISPEEFNRRLTELDKNKKRLKNEVEKAQQAIEQLTKEIEMVERNIQILEKAKKDGVASHTEEK